jgi:hypothetical protein
MEVLILRELQAQRAYDGGRTALLAMLTRSL